MNKYIQEEINRVRERTGSVVSSEGSSEGLTREVILDALSDADWSLQSAILDAYPHTSFFDTTTEISIVADQVEYTLPALARGPEVKLVEYSHDGQTKNYYRIDPIHYSEFDSYPSSCIDGWQLRGNKLIVSPPKSTSTGKLRVTYPAQLYKLDIRRGEVNTKSGFDITLESNSTDTYLGPAPSDTELGRAQYITLVDKDGTPQVTAQAITGYNSSTRAIACTPDSSVAAGQFVCVGPYSRTHSQLPHFCEPYRKLYAEMRVHAFKSNTDFNDSAPVLVAERDLVLSKFGHLVHGPLAPPSLNEEWR